MNKKILTTMLLILMIASMMVLTVGCGAKGNDADALADVVKALEAENASLNARIAELTAQLEGMKAMATLESWNLEAKAWSDGNGATVTFAAKPLNYVDGQRAALSVRMGDLEAEGTNCNWDGTSFVGSVELSAADGYSYYCVLTSPDGTQSEVELNSPNHVTNEMLVYLGSSLGAYGNMVVEDWEVSGNVLNIKSGYVQVQMPRLTYNNASFNVSSAALVLKLNDQEVDRKSVALTAGEGIGSFEATISGQTFTMPHVEEDCQLDLWLEVVLSTGKIISVSGGSWYSSDGQLQLAVG